MQALLEAIAAAPMPTDARRIFHGRGGVYPGCEQWSLDWFAPVWLLTSYKPANEVELERIQVALSQRWTEVAPPGLALNWVFQCRSAGQSTTRLMAGSVPKPHDVSEAGAVYRLHVLKGQNHGLFLDMANARQWVRDWIVAHPASHGHSPDLKVLNLFAYTCAFSVAALQSGAKQVVNVDMSAGALSIGQLNHRLNGLATGASFLPHDIFKSWGKIARNGPYHLVIVDPPSFQKGSFVATNDYVKLIRRLPALLQPDGVAMICLNAPELDTDFLKALVTAHAPDLRFVQRLANPSEFVDIDPKRALKVLLYNSLN
ncbi:MAG: class I SAM-dependent methyltransferase [Burkholderiaceae bacterium]